MFQKLKNVYHLFQAVIASIYYGFPSRKLKVIGVTGTDGKTTTTQLISHILNHNDKKVSFISTVLASVAGKVYDTGFHVTTPSPFSVQKFLKKSLNNHDEFFVLETTSHALDQNRIWGVRFKIGVITNITHEHLDYHKSYRDYVLAKEKLISMSETGLINEDDGSYKFLSQKSKVKSQKYNSKVKILGKLPDLTDYNKYNYSAAYMVCKQIGLSDEQILRAMKTFELPKGRLDLVYDKDFKIVIDFAHTPNALSQLLPSVRKLYLEKGGRLIHVFGSAGLRDFTKRPLMGEASGKYSNLVILTEEDYRTEDPIIISEAIASGLNKENFLKVNYNQLINCSSNSYSVIVNREKAIREAIKLAKKNDVIILTGKAHEKSLCRGKTEYPWDEYEAVRNAISLITNNKTQITIE